MGFFIKLNNMKGDRYSGYVYDGKNGIRFSENEEELIIENIKRILCTRKGERVNNPNFGSEVKSLLFLPQVYANDLIDAIKVAIEEQEPRVRVNEVTLIPTGKEIEDILTINLNLTIIGKKEISIGVNI